MLYTARHINGLPYLRINQLLPLALVHDTVHFSEKTISHMLERHPADYQICNASLELIVTAPDYTGQSPYHSENFELVKQVDDQLLLVALSVIHDEYGEYPVKSSYSINRATLNRRLRKRHLISL